MKHRLLPLAAGAFLLICAAHAQPPSIVPPDGKPIDGLADFGPLPEADARAKGALWARRDFQALAYRQLYYGEPFGTPPKWEVLIRQRYGVLSSPIAGCVVTPGIVAGADAYNTTMQQLLNEKFGKDIFAECRK